MHCGCIILAAVLDRQLPTALDLDHAAVRLIVLVLEHMAVEVEDDGAADRDGLRDGHIVV